ncbi:MAG TPA: DUF3341 domain-containing protein [Planctomycetota bacterium]|nr:DUF3341 domain-containing protein [Planctomycetota bacterium]
MTTPRLSGVLAEFGEERQLIQAARRARAAGYTRMDAYTPYPVDGLAEALGFRKTRVPLLILVGGLLGGLGGYGLQVWLNVWDYPINVGGRPLNSIPAWIIVTFELTILGAAIAAVLGMLALNRLPMPRHPVFGVEEFALATTNRFFLAIESEDPRFQLDQVRTFVTELGAKGVWDIEE